MQTRRQGEAGPRLGTEGRGWKGDEGWAGVAGWEGDGLVLLEDKQLPK